MSAHRAKPGSVAADEPVVAGHAALALVAYVGEFIVGRTHLVNAAQWSAVTSYLVPLVTTLLLAGSAVLMRRVVTPAAKVAQRVEDSVTASLAGQGSDVNLPDVDEALKAAGRVIATTVEKAVPVVPVRDPYASPGPVG